MLTLLDHAKLFATTKHVLDNHQLYGNVLPYTHHLAAVDEVLCRFGWVSEISNPELRAAAWLHDVVEDTAARANEVKVRDIEEIFGAEVAALVAAVTSEPGPNRKVRNALTYPKIRAAGRTATALKLADRIANVEHGGAAGKMYKAEHSEFRHALLVDGENTMMWRELDELIGCL